MPNDKLDELQRKAEKKGPALLDREPVVLADERKEAARRVRDLLR